MKFPKNIKTAFLFIILAILLAYGAYNTAGIALNTNIPVVSVVSNSMKHDYTIETTHYSFLMSKYNFTRKEINSWPLHSGFTRGDLLIVEGANASQIKVGDVIIYKLKNWETPECREFENLLNKKGIEKVVHRIIKKYENNGQISFITKGDHNFREDPCTIQPDEIQGKVIFRLPWLGYLKLIPAQIFGVV